MKKIYSIMATVSFLIRIFLLPNPFETIVGGLFINMLLEPILVGLAFLVAGFYYKKRSCPPLGSFLFCCFYATHTGLLILMSKFGWNQIAIIIIVVLYIALHIAAKIAKEKLCFQTSRW